MSALLETPKHKNLIYDVGMHRGEDTDFYLKKGFRVVAFDANPEMVAHCRTRFSKYLERGQLEIVEGAVMDPKSVTGGKTVTFYKNENGTAWGTVCQDWAMRNERLGNQISTIEVQSINFVETIMNYGVPHYLKIDIEGCDMICLDALRQFRERPNYISFESDKICLANTRHEINLLMALGYDSFQAVEQTGIPDSQFPPSPPKEGDYTDHRFECGASGLFGAELDGRWLSRSEVLRFYQFVHWGYRFLGDDGRLYRWQLPGASYLRRTVKWFLEKATKAQVPGWYDTHARLSSTAS